MRTWSTRGYLSVSLAIGMLGTGARAQTAGPEVPRIDGAWWPIAGNPALGALGSAWQQPVDFSIWQAADGTWQLWSCIRNTNCGGATRLFYRWESAQITNANWTPMGIAMQADPRFGEIPGGLQAPHVFVVGSTWYMVYGDWLRICLASSTDGKQFTRVLNVDGQPNLFTGPAPYVNARDPMVLRFGGLFVCYYTASQPALPYQGAVFCRTSENLVDWSEPLFVSAGGSASMPPTPGDAECPFVVERNGLFYLFRNQVYGPAAQNTQYASKNPFDFGVGNDKFRIGTLPIAAPEIVLYQGQYYIASLNPNLDGIRMARLSWVKP
jgi:hypothetical protein